MPALMNSLNSCLKRVIIDREASEIMHLVASARLFLPSAAKSIRSHYQSKVFVCVSVIRGRIRIIVRLRSIGVSLALHSSPKEMQL